VKKTKKVTAGTCRVCGCTDQDCRQCIRKTGRPCHWVDRSRTLCSACADPDWSGSRLS